MLKYTNFFNLLEIMIIAVRVKTAKKNVIKLWLTSVGIHSVDWVILRVQRVLQMELGVLQHPLNHIFYINSLWHVRRRHYVECSQTSIGRLGHSLHDEVAPQPLLIHGVIAL